MPCLPRAPQSVAQAARLLYQRMADFFPQSPLAPEAAWRSADIRWQLQKADVFSLPRRMKKTLTCASRSTMKSSAS